MPRRIVRAALVSSLLSLPLGSAGALEAQARDAGAVTPASALPLRQWGEEALGMIARDLLLPGRDLYAEKATTGRALSVGSLGVPAATGIGWSIAASRSGRPGITTCWPT